MPPTESVAWPFVDEDDLPFCRCCDETGTHVHKAATCEHVCCPDWDDEAP